MSYKCACESVPNIPQNTLIKFTINFTQDVPVNCAEVQYMIIRTHESLSVISSNTKLFPIFGRYIPTSILKYVYCLTESSMMC